MEYIIQAYKHLITFRELFLLRIVFTFYFLPFVFKLLVLKREVEMLHLWSIFTS